jgi:glutamyl-tRNA synthetase
MSGSVRVRFAPSPTGYLHIGGVRTALFNWLFARHHGGTFILRIEDTDEKRSVAGAADDLTSSLRWVGITWDEGPDIGGSHGPYVQSERHAAGIYRPFVERLLASGHAYKSFVSEDELSQARAQADAERRPFRYRGPERDWTAEQVAAREATGAPYTVRLKVPLEGRTRFHDLVRGGDGIEIDHTNLYDIVLLKSSGMPVYHLAHLVDDHLMQVTHVLRSDEWVPSTPYHVLLYQAFGWRPPIFAHLPPILRQDGRGKLSKRFDDVAANRFWERGYLPDAMFNYLALQGWSYDDHTEIMTRDEVVARFGIERVQPSPARWNPDKLLDMNGIYIRALAPAALIAAVTPFLVHAGLLEDPPTAQQQALLQLVVPLIHERLKELGEAPALLEFFMREVAPHGSDAPLTYDPQQLIPRKLDAATTAAALAAVGARLATLDAWSVAALEEALRGLCTTLDQKPGPLFGMVRVAVTGRTIAPPLFETLAALGRERTLSRVAAAHAALA